MQPADLSPILHSQHSLLLSARKPRLRRRGSKFGRRHGVSFHTSPTFARKSRLVDRHPLYVSASAAPHVRASHYGLRLAHDSGQYDHGPKITTTDWQTRSAGDKEVTTSKPGGSMVGTICGATEHWLAVVSLNDALSEYYRNDLRIYRAALESGFTDEQWQAIKRGR